MKNLIRGIAVLLTAVFLCFNIYYELAPESPLPRAEIRVCSDFCGAFACCAVLRRAGQYASDTAAAVHAGAVSVLHMGAAECAVFDNAFGRGFGHTSLDMVNLEPLRTVKNYLLAYGYGNISLRLVVLNLAGNLIAFAPMGVFLPALFRWQRSIFFFTASLTLSITAVEVLQVYTGTGSCDVDDLILNLAGALLVLSCAE